MRIAIMQPTYLPWLGYFELMANSEYFVYFDDVQFVKKSWQQRNKIKSATGEQLLAVPVLSKGKHTQNINEALINNTEMWRRKHLSSIDYNYKKAPFYEKYIKELQTIYSKEYDILLDFNLAIMSFLRSKLGITTPCVLSSELNVGGERNERIINICKRLKADELYDAAGAKELLDLAQFEANGVKLVFQEYTHPVYKQIQGPFLSHLSVLDLLFNEGDRSLEIIKSGAVKGA